MKVLKVIVDEMPKKCNSCKYLEDMRRSLRDNEYITGTPTYCLITLKALYIEDCYVKRPSWCPLEVETDGWIAVSERLPEHPNWVIACDKTGYAYPAVYHDKEWHDDIDGIPYHPITHWRPIPELEVKGE